MINRFCKYFIQYIYHAKTRQRLLFLAIVGLFLSSFALIVLQSCMGGLQSKLIERSKKYTGTATLELNGLDRKSIKSLQKLLVNYQLRPITEYRLELLIRNGNYIAPVIVHGIDPQGELPAFISKEELSSGIIMGIDLASKIKVYEEDEINLISPSHVNSFFGDIPRSVTHQANQFLLSNVPDVDLYHAWVRLSSVQNLIRKREVNLIRLFEDIDFSTLKDELKSSYGSKVVLKTWNERNKTLVWALNLETMVMVFLFAAMTLLVSLSITSGLLIFFSKIKSDLASFWIMGTSKRDLEKASAAFLNLMSFVSVASGLLFGLLFLFLFDRYAGEIMSDVFVDRKIPVNITTNGLLISFFVPYTISIVFGLFSLNQFKKEANYLEHVRSVGP